MFQLKCSLLLLFVATLLTASCGEGVNSEEENVGLDGVDFMCNSTANIHFVYGIAANLFAVLLYGSNLVHIKKVETGDGMFFQWVNCAGIWAVSLVGNLLLNSPKFYPLAMLGGVIWATGNVAVVTILKAIGLSLGILIWGSASLLMGWASSRFGWFGISAQDVSRPLLNYCGAGLCMLSGMIFFYVKADVEPHPSSDSIPLLLNGRTSSGNYGPNFSEFWMDAQGPKTRRFIGCLLAVVVGLMYGSTFVPILYIKNHSSCHDSIFYGASMYDLDYVYAQGCGIFLASTVYFVVYCAAMNNKPKVYPQVILPGLLSGLMWALATYCWFLANNYLSSVITFPIVTAGYSLVAALWGSLIFREIKGLFNCVLLFFGTCVVVVGSVLTAFSKY